MSRSRLSEEGFCLLRGPNLAKEPPDYRCNQAVGSLENRGLTFVASYFFSTPLTPFPALSERRIRPEKLQTTLVVRRLETREPGISLDFIEGYALPP